MTAQNVRRKLRVVEFKNTINLAARDGSDPNKLIIRNDIEIDGEARVNKAVFIYRSAVNDHEARDTVYLKIINGHDRETGKQRACNIRFDKKDLKILKKWLDMVDEGE